ADTNGANGAQISLDGGSAATLGNGGSFSFPGTGPGKHTVSLADLSGWTQTTPNHHVLATDCGTDTSCVTFTSGDSTHVAGKLFGLFHNATINGVTYEDMNGDGTQDTGDTHAVPGATFRLDANGPTSA